jgi:hypothetical protein
VRGSLDAAGVAKRRQARSKYGAKRPKSCSRVPHAPNRIS